MQILILTYEGYRNDDIFKKNPTNKFSADYSKLGTAKCEICKNQIIKDGWRIEIYTAFNSKTITSYHHPSYVFNKMRKARVKSSVTKDLVEIDGIEHVSDEDNKTISNHINENAAYMTNPLNESYSKKTIPMKSYAARGWKLQVVKSPSIKVLFKNAYPLNFSKKNELQNRIVTEKTMIVAVSEVKPNIRVLKATQSMQ